MFLQVIGVSGKEKSAVAPGEVRRAFWTRPGGSRAGETPPVFVERATDVLERKAELFAEEAITGLSRLDVATARTAIAEAFDVDHKIGALADAVYLACAEIEEEGWVSTATWNTLADAVDSPDLLAVVEASRS